MILLLLILIFILYLIYDPFIDIFTDFRGEYHIILWYNYKGERRFINIIGEQ